MKKIYFIISVIALAAVSLLLPFNIDKNRAQASPQCFDGLDNDSASDGIDFGVGVGFDPECICPVDDDENVWGDGDGDGYYYISYDQDFAGLPFVDVWITHSCGTVGDVAELCSNFNGNINPTCPTGWVCTTTDTSASCYVGLERMPLDACNAYDTVADPTLAVCATPYEACNCTCPGGPLPISGSGCATPAGDADSDGDDCDYSLGENMFNCPTDCLPDGIPNKAIEDAIEDAVIWILGLAVAISIVMLIYGGLYYVTSSGDTEKAATSKKIIKYALLGVAIAGVSFVIVKLLDYIIG